MSSPTLASSALTPLRLHESELRTPSHRIFAMAQSLDDGQLELTFEVENSDRILWPISAPSSAEGSIRREDGLWSSTCFECFIGGTDEGYFEWNFAPNGNWAAYAFSSYRTGMRNPTVSSPKVRETVLDGNRKRYSVFLKPSEVSIAKPMNYSLTAVALEVGQAAPFYWAVHHAGSKPDFHLRNSFSLRMEF